MIIGILGFAGTGKDAVADIIVKHGAQRVAFADDLKRMTRDLFGFTDEQMWGSMDVKETPDKRYPREHTWGQAHLRNGVWDSKCLCCNTYAQDPDGSPCFLTPRYALQILGTEGGRQCYANIWVERALKFARNIEEGLLYSRESGIWRHSGYDNPRVAVFTDARFINEVAALQEAGGKVFRVKRPGFEKPRFNHASETEQLSIPDDRLQGVIDNDGTLGDLERKVLALF